MTPGASAILRCMTFQSFCQRRPSALNVLAKSESSRKNSRKDSPARRRDAANEDDSCFPPLPLQS